MPVGLLVLVFGGVWASATWVIHRCQQRHQRPLEERLRPYVRSVGDEAEQWLQDQPGA